MTVTSQIPVITYDGTGQNNTWPVPFEIPYQSDGVTPAVTVFTTNVATGQVTPVTNFTVTGVGVETSATVYTSSAVPLNYTLTIMRALQYNQPDSFPNQGFLPSSVEAALDNQTLQIQQLAEVAERSIVGAPGEQLTSLEPAYFRAGKLLGFDSNGNPQTYPVATQVSSGALELLTSFGTGDAAWAAAAAAGVDIYVPQGTYTITGSHTFFAQLIFATGAVVSGASPVTLTLNGGIIAPVAPIFGSNLTVTFSRQTNVVAYPEWWGAQTNNSSVDCSIGINAALASGAYTTHLQPCDYWISSAIHQVRAYTELRGSGSDFAAVTNDCTRILKNFSGGPAYIFGALTQPGGGINAFTRGLVCADICIAGGVGTVGAPGTEFSAGEIGLLAQFSLGGFIKRVKSMELSISFALSGTVGLKLVDCNGFRSAPASNPYSTNITASLSENLLTVTATSGVLGAGTEVTGAGVPANTVILGQNSGTSGGDGVYQVSTSATVASEAMTTKYDPYWGFYLNGALNIGADAGNASLYIIRANVSLGGNPVPYSIGLFSTGQFEDTYIEGFETSQAAVGILISAISNLSVGNYDLKIRDIVLDSCGQAALIIAEASFCSILIEGGYITSNNVAALQLLNCQGSITISGVEVLGVAQQGFYFFNTQGVQTFGCRFIEQNAPMLISDCSNISVKDSIQNFEIGTGQGAITLGGTNSCIVVDSSIEGKVNGIGYGVVITGTGTTRSEFRMTGINSNCINGGAGNKLVYNSTQITAAGAFGTNNLAAGVMA